MLSSDSMIRSLVLMYVPFFYCSLITCIMLSSGFMIVLLILICSPPFYFSHIVPGSNVCSPSFYCSHIMLSSGSMIVLRELSDRAGWGRVKYKRSFEYILKITAKKKNPDIITFKFGTGTGEDAEITEQLRFRIPNTGKATAAIKNQILKHQES